MATSTSPQRESLSGHLFPSFNSRGFWRTRLPQCEDFGNQALSTMTPAVHGSRAQRKTSTSILRHEYFSAASPHRSHPDACPACFYSPSWSSCAWRRDELYVAKRFFEREMAYATAEAPVGYRPRRLAGTCICRDLSGRVLVKSRTCGRALTFPEVDASSAPTNGPRFKYTLPSQLFCSQRPLRRTESRSRFLGLEIIFKRSTTKSTALAFVRQPFPMHSAFIFRRRQTSESSFISSHRNRPRLSATVLDMHMKLLLARPASVSAAHGSRTQCITYASSFRSTTKSTSLAFARQPPTTHSALIFRRGRTPESSFISSHPSRPRFSLTVPDMHVKLLPARPASISAAHGSRTQCITSAFSFWFFGLEIIFKRSTRYTTKSTALAFARQPLRSTSFDNPPIQLLNTTWVKEGRGMEEPCIIKENNSHSPDLEEAQAHKQYWSCTGLMREKSEKEGQYTKPPVASIKLPTMVRRGPNGSRKGYQAGHSSMKRVGVSWAAPQALQAPDWTSSRGGHGGTSTRGGGVKRGGGEADKDGSSFPDRVNKVSYSGEGVLEEVLLEEVLLEEVLVTSSNFASSFGTHSLAAALARQLKSWISSTNPLPHEIQIWTVARQRRRPLTPRRKMITVNTEPWGPPQERKESVIIAIKPPAARRSQFLGDHAMPPNSSSRNASSFRLKGNEVGDEGFESNDPVPLHGRKRHWRLEAGSTRGGKTDSGLGRSLLRIWVALGERFGSWQRTARKWSTFIASGWKVRVEGRLEVRLVRDDFHLAEVQEEGRGREAELDGVARHGWVGMSGGVMSKGVREDEVVEVKVLNSQNGLAVGM
ncbi:hypothetical protein DFH06DRAFT_1127515 [Mycena polygramma]|nr:hypothetical protein DFH06DRAFT_1127515 [Mycena polygramma]